MMGNFVGYCGLFESLKTSMIQAMKEHVGIEEEWVTPLGQGQKTEEAERDGRFTSTVNRVVNYWSFKTVI